jgi:regulator of nonsense transcripts 1
VPHNNMDSFDNFQYDSASSYGGLGVADDTSSVYNTQDGVDLSLSEYNGSSSVDHEPNHHQHPQARNGLDEDFDAVLDDLKDEGVLDLPPHACRCAVPFKKIIKINNSFLIFF